jgi:cell division protein FtsL
MIKFRDIGLRLLPILAVTLAIIQIVLTNQLAGSGKKVRSVDITVDQIRQENDMLEQKVASASSLLTISAKATEMGFVEPSKSQYLTIVPEQLPVAFNNQ